MLHFDDTLKSILYNKLIQTSTQESIQWIESKIGELKTDFSPRTFFLSFSASFRFFSKSKVDFTPDETTRIVHQHEHWNTANMKQYEIARLLIYLCLPTDDKKYYFEIVGKLFSAADMGELEMLYKHLIVYPFSEDYVFQTTEGIRTNIKSVFESVAINNPYPAKYLSEIQWNQMILKCIFNSCQLKNIIGLEQRANEALATSLTDYAHERWAAKRVIHPELWKLVSKFYTPHLLQDFKKLLESESTIDKLAGALACKESKNQDAIELLLSYPEIVKQLNKEVILWDELSDMWYKTLV